MPSELCPREQCRKLRGHRGRHDAYPTGPLLSGLPDEIYRKIDKTSMTRGAQPYGRVPYQNRVRRWNRAVIPFAFRNHQPPEGFENGHVIMVRPSEYFDPETRREREEFPEDVVIGQNAFLYYDNRRDWMTHPPDRYAWRPRRYLVNGRPSNRRSRGGEDVGEYIARAPATTTPGEAGAAIVKGDPQGIRFFEYASHEETWKVMMQLGYLAWKTEEIEKVANGPMSEHLRAVVEESGLADEERLEHLRTMQNGTTCCPLCLEPINATMLMEKIEQMEGREVVDLTVTEATLFHLEELRPGLFNHRVYKVGWGHYYCNTVTKDAGVEATLGWMERVLRASGRID